MKKIILIALVIASVTFARLGGIGASSAFLKMGGGARPSALGYAYAGFADGLDAIYWNPAGITTVSKNTFSFTHANLFAGMYLENLAIGIPLGRNAIGIQITGHLSGRILMTAYEDQLGEGEHYFTANNYAIGVTYASKLTDKFSSGFGVKVINMNIHKVSATAVAFDIGGTYETGIQNTKLGFVALNYSPTDVAFKGEALEFMHAPDTLMSEDVPSTYESEPFPLPLTFLGGLSTYLFKTSEAKLAFAADFGYLIDQGEVFALGMEYSISDRYFFRVGYTNRNNRDLSGGIGFVIPRPMYKILMDYAVEHHKYLPMIHRVSVGMVF